MSLSKVPKLGIGNVRGLESEIEEFKPSSNDWNRELKSSIQVRGLESGMEEFELSSETWKWEKKSSSQV